jgi:hypothetical protein
MSSPTVLSLDRYQYAALAARNLKEILPSTLVCDIGAGLAQMRGPIESVGLQWQGFDLIPSAASIRSWDLDTVCPEPCPQAGLVLLLEVLEHLRNPGLALRHVGAVMLPNARLVLTTPNPRWSRSRLNALRTGFPSCFTQDDLDLNGHVFPIWPHIMRKMLAEAGFEVEQYATLDGRTPWPDNPCSLNYPLRLAHAAVNKWIERRDPSSCGMSYAMIARKIDTPKVP